MTKQETIEEMANKTGISKRNCSDAYDSIVDIMMNALEQKDEFRIDKFGVFKVVLRPERKGTNPQTQKPMTIPERYAVIFKPFTGLNDKMKALSEKPKKKAKAPAKKKTASKKKTEKV